MGALQSPNDDINFDDDLQKAMANNSAPSLRSHRLKRKLESFNIWDYSGTNSVVINPKIGSFAAKFVGLFNFNLEF